MDNNKLFEELARFEQALDGQLVVSQSRCVDGLLDLYNLTESDAARRVLAGALDDVRHISMVESASILRQLRLVSAVLSVEEAFEQVAA